MILWNLGGLSQTVESSNNVAKCVSEGVFPVYFDVSIAFICLRWPLRGERPPGGPTGYARRPRRV